MCSTSVVFLENELLYGQSFPVEDEVLTDEFIVPIGKCKIERYFVVVNFSPFCLDQDNM